MNDSDPIPFSRIIAELLDPDALLSPSHAIHLSRMGEQDVDALKKVWVDIPLERRRSLVADLEAFADANPLLFFEPVGWIALDDTDPQVRSSAIQLLTLEENPDLIHRLLEMLENDEHFEVRGTAAEALGTYVYLGELDEIPENLYRQVENALITATKGDSQELVRRKALEAVSFSSRSEINGLIEDAYASGNEDWRISAVFAMGASANQIWKTQVMEEFHAESTAMRLEAARAAGKLGLQDAKPSLFDLAQNDGDVNVRMAAVWALSDLGGSEVSVFIETLLDAEQDDEARAFYEDALDNCIEASFLLEAESDFPLFEFDPEDLSAMGEIDLGEDEDDED